MNIKKQPFFEDIGEGEEITPLVKCPTPRQLAMWAGASDDYNPIHYDKDYALEHDLPGIIVPGQLAGCFLVQMLTDWMGGRGNLKQVSFSYKGMNLPGEELFCKGIVTGKYIEDGCRLISAKIWAENPRGEKTITGTAVIELPGKNS
jgi:acyl dehydratase